MPLACTNISDVISRGHILQDESVVIMKKVFSHRADIVAAGELCDGNGRNEAINNKIKMTLRTGHRFRNARNLVAMLILKHSKRKPQFPSSLEKPSNNEPT